MRVQVVMTLPLEAARTDHSVFDSVTRGGGSVHLMKTLRWTDVPGIA
jgi:hypothetical protein